MTREQLDAIRARLDEVPFLPFEATLVFQLCANVRALLDEVERLTAELAANPQYTFRGGYIEDESGDRWWSAGLLAKVEAERDAAFARGVAAMRKAAAQRCEISPIHGEKTTTARKYADAVRALPDPEDK